MAVDAPPPSARRAARRLVGRVGDPAHLGARERPRRSGSAHFGFQLGVFVPNGSPAFRLAGRVLAPFSGLTPQPGQEMGIMLGPGDHDDFAEVVVGAGNGSGEVRFRLEVGGQAMTTHALPLSLPGPDAVDLSFRVDPIHSTIRARYVVISGGAVWTDGSVGPARHRPELLAVRRLARGRSDLLHPRRRPGPRDVGLPVGARVTRAGASRAGTVP